MQPKKSSLVILVAVLILFVMSACLGGPATPTPTPTVCPPLYPNLYFIPQQVKETYADWNNFTQLQALGLLTSQVERYSDYEDIIVDSTATYRIVVTLITPDVRRAAFVMEAVHRNQNGQQIKEGITDIFNKHPDLEVLRFLVTVTLKYTGPDLAVAPDKVAIDPKQLIMLDRHGNEVSPDTFEGTWLTSFNAVNGPFAAYITYSLRNSGDCSPAIDVLQDPSITLHLKEFKLKDTVRKDLAWTVNLSPLISVGIPPLPPNPTPSGTGTPAAYLEPKTIPPTPNPGDMNALSLDNYWIDFTKFIWSKLSASNSR